MKTALFILIPATSLLYMSIHLEEFERPKAFALISFACFAFFFVDWRLLLKDKISTFVPLFVLSAVASTLTTIDWHVSFFGNPKAPMGLLVVASLLVVYVAALQTIKKISDIEVVAWLFVALSNILSIYAILQVFGVDFKDWQGVLNMDGYVRPMSLLGHPNFLANYLAMTLPFFLWLYSKSKYWDIKAFLFLGMLSSLAAIFYSQSRGMWIAAVAGVTVYYAISGVTKTQVLRILATLSLVIASTTLISKDFRNTVMDRVHHLFTPGTARIEYPLAALRIWAKYPVFGSGTDTFETAFQHERTAHYWDIERAGSPHRAHNDFLNVLATQGAFGALILLFLTWAIIAKARIVASKDMAAPIAAICVFYVAGLSGFVVISTGVLFMVTLSMLSIER